MSASSSETSSLSFRRINSFKFAKDGGIGPTKECEHHDWTVIADSVAGFKTDLHPAYARPKWEKTNERKRQREWSVEREGMGTHTFCDSCVCVCVCACAAGMENVHVIRE